MRIGLIGLMLVFGAEAVAQSVTYHEKDGIGNLMWSYRSYNQKRDMERGYRHHIMFTNNREEAYNVKTKVLKALPDMRCYVVYEQPYYKVRVGDFRTKEEAQESTKRIIAAFPGSFIINDKIKIK